MHFDCQRRTAARRRTGLAAAAGRLIQAFPLVCLPLVCGFVRRWPWQFAHGTAAKLVNFQLAPRQSVTHSATLRRGGTFLSSRRGIYFAHAPVWQLDARSEGAGGGGLVSPPRDACAQ